MVTSQGIVEVLKARPVDVLKQLLEVATAFHNKLVGGAESENNKVGRYVGSRKKYGRKYGKIRYKTAYVTVL